MERATPSSLFSKNCWLFKHSESKTKFHTVIQANILSCSCDQNQCICKPNAAKYCLIIFFDNIIESKYHLVGGVQFILNKCLSSQPIIPVWLKIKLWNPPTNQALLCNTMMVEVPTGEYHLDDRRHPKNSSGKASPDPMLRETYCNNLYNYWQIIGSQCMQVQKLWCCRNVDSCQTKTGPQDWFIWFQPNILKFRSIEKRRNAFNKKCYHMNQMWGILKRPNLPVSPYYMCWRISTSLSSGFVSHFGHLIRLAIYIYIYLST